MATVADSETVAASAEDEVAIAEDSEAVVAETAAASEVAAHPEDADLRVVAAVVECAVAKQSSSNHIATKVCSFFSNCCGS